MNFLILGNFLDFFWIYFRFLSIKNNFKKAKKGVYFRRGCDVARKATWQSHADPRERLRGAKVTRVMHIYIYS